MIQPDDLACIALTASAYEKVDAAASVEAVNTILEHAEAARAYARHTKNRQLEADANKIRLYAEVRLFELLENQQSEPM